MEVQITIKKVPKEVRDELAARAALKRQSMQAYLLGELERIVSKPPIEEVMEEINARLAVSKTRVTAEDILEAIHEGRR